MSCGDIVGVRGGKITKNTVAADHIMVISSAPVVLGNMPEADQQSNFEKVAFLGQVPVKVQGRVAIGDYILPNGEQQGIGIAVSPQQMSLSDYSHILGVAWQASEEESVKLINTAIGLNHNDLLQVIHQQQAELNRLSADMAEIKAMLGLEKSNDSND